MAINSGRNMCVRLRTSTGEDMKTVIYFIRALLAVLLMSNVLYCVGTVVGNISFAITGHDVAQVIAEWFVKYYRVNTMVNFVLFQLFIMEFSAIFAYRLWPKPHKPEELIAIREALSISFKVFSMYCFIAAVINFLMIIGIIAQADPTTSEWYAIDTPLVDRGLNLMMFLLLAPISLLMERVSAPPELAEIESAGG